MLLSSFSIFSDRWSLKIEKENNYMKTLTAEAPYIQLETLEFGLWIYKLTLAGWNYLWLEINFVVLSLF